MKEEELNIMGFDIFRRKKGTQQQSNAQQSGSIGPEFFKKEAEFVTMNWAHHQLDYSIESLKRLDQFIDGSYPKDRFQNAIFGKKDNFNNSAYTNLTINFGSYFGELLIRQLNGKWITSPSLNVWVININGLEINVFHIAQECFHETSKYYAVFSVAKLESGGH
jgi:hypothetical protein